MNHAERVKGLVDQLEDSYHANEGPYIDSGLASKEVRAAIDEMQAEIDRLRDEILQQSTEMAADIASALYSAWCVVGAPSAGLEWRDFMREFAGIRAHVLGMKALKAKGDKAMAELQKEAQERGDCGRGDKT